LFGVTTLPDIDYKDRNAPFNTDVTPADGHGVYFLATLCGQQNATRQRLADIVTG
jgi:hypothetical protein